MQTWQQWRNHIITMLVTLLLVAAGWLALVPRPQAAPITIVEPTPAPTATTVLWQVHVAGAVRRPGVYPFAPGSRVADAITAAGGLRANADAEGLNLAGHLADAQRLYVPFRGTPAPPEPTPLAEASAGGSAGGKLNLNTATAEELTALPGIGPTYAESIVAYREAHGGFAAPEEVLEVPGIGEGRYEQIKDLITVE